MRHEFPGGHARNAASVNVKRLMTADPLADFRGSRCSCWTSFTLLYGELRDLESIHDLGQTGTSSTTAARGSRT
jgi:hypothetical protein